MATNEMLLALALLIRFEAGPEYGEQVRVASVVCNRWHDPGRRWGTTLEQVVFRRHQFAVWDFVDRDCMEDAGEMFNGEESNAWAHAAKLAGEILRGTFEPETAATHFHGAGIEKPATWRRCVEVARSQWHIFYREDT